jgi:glutathione S-transferase
VLVEEDGGALGDSNAIAQYLEIAYPEKPALFPKDAKAARDALAIMAAVDVAMNAIVDCGTRIYELRGDPAWPDVKGERMARAQDAIEFVASKATRPILAGDAWSAADIWVYAATRWVSAFPARVETSPQIARIVTLGFKLPDALVAWSKPHDSRPDVRSIYG